MTGITSYLPPIQLAKPLSKEIGVRIPKSVHTRYNLRPLIDYAELNSFNRLCRKIEVVTTHKIWFQQTTMFRSPRGN